MTSFEKAELLKSTIEHLYSSEGRSISYISKLLEINRKTLSGKIAEWKLPEADPRHHFTPSVQKFVNRNRQLIKARLDANVPVSKIADELSISRHSLGKTIIPNDEVLRRAYEDYARRAKDASEQRRTRLMEKSSLDYQITDLPGEVWAPILGYSGYMVSNKGRVKHYSTKYHAYHLISAFPNSQTGRPYVTLYRDGEKKNLMLARLVGHAFVAGYSNERNTINHLDGNVSSSAADNLEWASQGENNAHSYHSLNRKKNSGKRYDFQKIIFREKYEFKTVAAFARFIGKSETQARRYLNSPAKHNIELVK